MRLPKQLYDHLGIKATKKTKANKSKTEISF